MAPKRHHNPPPSSDDEVDYSHVPLEETSVSRNWQGGQPGLAVYSAPGGVERFIVHYSSAATGRPGEDERAAGEPSMPRARNEPEGSERREMRPRREPREDGAGDGFGQPRDEDNEQDEESLFVSENGPAASRSQRPRQQQREDSFGGEAGQLDDEGDENSYSSLPEQFRAIRRAAAQASTRRPSVNSRDVGGSRRQPTRQARDEQDRDEEGNPEELGRDRIPSPYLPLDAVSWTDDQLNEYRNQRRAESNRRAQESTGEPQNRQCKSPMSTQYVPAPVRYDTDTSRPVFAGRYPVASARRTVPDPSVPQPNPGFYTVNGRVYRNFRINDESGDGEERPNRGLRPEGRTRSAGASHSAAVVQQPSQERDQQMDVDPEIDPEIQIPHGATMISEWAGALTGAHPDDLMLIDRNGRWGNGVPSSALMTRISHETNLPLSDLTLTSRTTTTALLNNLTELRTNATDAQRHIRTLEEQIRSLEQRRDELMERLSIRNNDDGAVDIAALTFGQLQNLVRDLRGRNEELEGWFERLGGERRDVRQQNQRQESERRDEGSVG